MATKQVDLGWVVIDRNQPSKVIARAYVREAGVIGQIANHHGADACTIQLALVANFAKLSTDQLFELYQSIKGTPHPAQVSGMDHGMAFPIVVKDVAELCRNLPFDPRTIDQLESEAERKGINRHVPEARNAHQPASNGATRPAKAPRVAKAPPAPGDAPARPPAGTTTGMVWDIADKTEASTALILGSKHLRAAIIAACIADNVHPSTAATQYSKWVRNRNATK